MAFGMVDAVADDEPVRDREALELDGDVHRLRALLAQQQAGAHGRRPLIPHQGLRLPEREPGVENVVDQEHRPLPHAAGRLARKRHPAARLGAKAVAA